LERILIMYCFKKYLCTINKYILIFKGIWGILLYVETFDYIEAMNLITKFIQFCIKFFVVESNLYIKISNSKLNSIPYTIT
jgi:hypothetical protein